MLDGLSNNTVRRSRGSGIVLFALVAIATSLMVCCILADASDQSEAASSGHEGGVHWEYSEDGRTLTISKDGDGKIKDYLGKGTFSHEYSAWANAHEYNTTCKHVIIEEGVIRIGEYSFQHNDHIDLISVTIPSSMETIKHDSFEDVNIAFLTIPIDVESSKMITNASVLKEIRFTPGKTGKGYDYSKSQRNDTITHVSHKRDFKLVFEEGITKIGSFTCYKADHVTMLPEFPSTLKEIGNGAFEGCERMAGHLVISDLITKVGKYAFKNCEKIQELTIPVNVDTVVDDDDDNEVFYECSNIKKITFTRGSGSSAGIGVDYNGDNRDNTPWYYSRNTLKEVVFQEGITKLGRDQCYGVS